MTGLRSWYTDGERYVGLDEVRAAIDDLQDHPATEGEVVVYTTLAGLVPADCSVCDGPIPEDATHPLCKRCEGTAKAYARYFPEGPEAA